jgi:hypothetical protein
MTNEELRDEDFRLECLKLAAPLYPYVNGYGEPTDRHLREIPNHVTETADKYYAYIKGAEMIPLMEE